MPGPFAGVRVVEAAEGIGGPFTGMLLADLGAEVVKVEPPAGDRLRGTPTFHVLNRGKQSIVADLHSAAGRDRLPPLLAGADALIVGGPPGSHGARGLDAAPLRAAYPALILVQMPYYGMRGPLRDLPEEDSLLGALSGFYVSQPSDNGAPVHLTLPIASHALGVQGAQALGAALIARQRSGRGMTIEVSGLSAAYAYQGGAYISSGGAKPPTTSFSSRGVLPTYRYHLASDDKWFFVAALTPGQWVKLAAALGLDDLLADPDLSDGPMAIQSVEALDRLTQRVEAIFAGEPRAHWLEVLAEADVPNAPVQSRDEFLREEQVDAVGALVTVDDPELGPTQQIAPPAQFHGTPTTTPAGAPPLDPAAVSAVWESRQLTPNGPNPQLPLEGLLVLDLGTFVAGAYASTFLADLGADVIKVEPPDGDPWRQWGLGFAGWNRGKRSLAVNLRTAEGQAVLHRLVDRADIVLDNSRPGATARLAADYDTLSAVNPHVITVSSPSNGSSGPLKMRPAFDQIFQARSGSSLQQGGGDGHAPVMYQIAINDHTTAAIGALAGIAGAYARHSNGGPNGNNNGQRVETSLLQNSMTIAIGEFIDYPDRPPSAVGGTDTPGPRALYRLYEAADGWLFLALAEPEQWQALAHALERPDWLETWDAQAALGEPNDGALATALAATLASRGRDDLFADLLAAGVPCAPCLGRRETLSHEHAAANDLWADLEHPRWGALRQTGRFLRAEGVRPPPRRAPELGEHTEEILAEFGFSPTEIAQLLETGVVRAPSAATA